MENAIKILILEHDMNDLELLQYTLKKSGLTYSSEVVQDRREFENALPVFQPEIILSDFSLPSFDGFSAFKIKEQLLPGTPFIIVSGTIGDENAVELIKSGVTDYVLKEKLYQVAQKIERALNEVQAKKQKAMAELQLIQREEQLQKILNLSLDIIFTVDRDGKFVTVSPACKRVLDYQPEELIGNSVTDFIYEEDKEKTREAFANLRYGIDIINLENRYIRKSGAVVTLLWSVRWHSDETGYGVAKEITEIKAAEERIKQNERRFRALLQNSTDGLTLLAEDGTVIERSQNALRILGLNPEEVAGPLRHDLVHPDDLPILLHACEEVRENPEYLPTIEYRFLKPDGNYACIETSVQNRLNEPAVNAIVLNFRDITERKRAELALKKNELILRKGEEIAHLGTWHMDLRNGRVHWSDESFRLLGLLPGEEEPSLDLYLSFVHPDDLPMVKEATEASEKSHQNTSLYQRIIRKDGAIRHLLSDNKFEFDPATKELTLFGVLLDVTDQKLAEERLRYSESRLKEAQAIGQMGSWEFNFSTGITTWSDELYKLHELDKDVFEPSIVAFISLIHPEDQNFASEMIDTSMAKMEDGTFGFRYIRSDGEIRYAYTKWHFEFDKSGNPIGLFGIEQDITEKKLADLALQESEEKYRSLFELSPLPMWVFDVETYRFLNVNEAAVRYYGYSRTEFLNMTIKDIRPETDIEALQEIVGINNSTGTFFQGVVNHLNKNGELIQVEIQSNLICYEDKKARVVLARDISERVKYVNAIEEQNKKLREIAWQQSHVVRAPLARLMGLASLLQDYSYKEVQIAELVNHLMASSVELDKVIRDIIKETDKIEIDPSEARSLKNGAA